MSSKLRIAIVGAGPAGLSLGRLLSMQGHAPTVFERERYALADPEGGVLALDTPETQRILAEAGLLDAFASSARPAHAGVRWLDAGARVLYEHWPVVEGSVGDVERGAIRARSRRARYF